MNPFDLRGPQFLAFYAALTLLTLLVIRWLRRSSEMRLQPVGGTAKRDLVLSHTHPELSQSAFADPYLIAYLRGGAAETIRTATVSLVDRGLLSLEGEKVRTSSTGSRTEVRKTVERALLEYCATSSDPRRLYKDSKLVEACHEYEQQLVMRNLLPDETINADRRVVFNGAIAVLIAVSAVKLIVAFARGRSNVLFLIILTVAAVVAAYAVAFPRQTAAGKAFLDEVRNLFSALKLRAAQIRPGGATAELVLLVAVFGTDAIKGGDFAWTRLLFPLPETNTSGGSGSSCGSSCGGGCGGGCGGCGG
jgi:uncharacterized protein (TIGR04222 family)